MPAEVETEAVCYASRHCAEIFVRENDVLRDVVGNLSNAGILEVRRRLYLVFEQRVREFRPLFTDKALMGFSRMGF